MPPSQTLPSLQTLPAQANLIAGEHAEVTPTGLPLACPDTGIEFARSATSGGAAVDAAVSAAVALHDGGEWSDAPLAGRLALLDDLAGRLEGLSEELAFADTVDSGVPIAVTRLFAAGLPDVVRGAADRARRAALYRELDGDGGAVSLYQLPWGPAGVLAPFNAPAFTAVKKSAYAIAAGCPVILKPSPHAPHAANHIAAAMREALAAQHAPPALFQLLHGGADVGSVLAGHPGVRCLAFTGGRAAGRAVAAAAASSLKALQLECGSNNAAIVRADADIDATAASLVAGFTKLNGQWCERPGTVAVPAHLHDQLLDAILDRVAALACGPSTDPATVFGPQANLAQQASVQSAIRRVSEGGARAHAPLPVPADGFYVSPTVLTGAGPGDTAAEIFGPVLVLHPVRDDTEAMAIANSREGGLAAYVFTEDVTSGRELGRRLVAGEVKINGTSVLDLHADSAQGFWAGSGIGGHGNSELLAFFLGTRIVGPDLPDPPL